MANLDIIILSSIVTTLFAVFIGATIRELSKSEQPKGKENSPRAKMIKNIGKMFDSEFEIK